MSAVLMSPAVALYINGPVIAGFVGPAVPLVFLLSLIAIIPTAWAVGQCSRKVSSAGSFYAFVERAAGRAPGCLTGWALFGAYGALAVGGCASFGAFVSEVAKSQDWGSFSWLWPALISCAVAVVLSLRGVQVSEVVSVVMLGIELMVIIALSVSIFLHGGAEGFSLAPFNPVVLVDGSSGLRLAVVFGVLSFVGFEVAATLAEETRNATRTIPRAVVGATAVVGLILIVGSYAAVLGYGTLHSADFAGDAGAFDTLVGRYLGPAQTVADLVLLNALFGAVLSIINGFSRVTFAMARDGVLPRQLSHTHAKHGTPSAAIYATGVLITAVLTPLSILGVAGLDAYVYVSTPGVVLVIVVYIASDLLLGRLYIKHYRSEFGVLRHVVVPTFGALVLLIPLVAQFYPVPEGVTRWIPYIAVAWLAAGIALIPRALRNKREVDLNSASSAAPVDSSIGDRSDERDASSDMT
ncbi:APC family permease [Nocardia sp. NPDC051570]|uniref:APC family permease n=1 Tax=Nocardia sp. NPDC051570 TaxID=3364324 RepID=UPI0037B253F7